MKQISNIFLIVICALALSWFLPWLWSFMTPSTASTPFCAYSPILNDWIIASDMNSSSKQFHDTKGNSYNTTQRDSLLPQLYYRDLMAHDRMPDSINGKHVTIPALKHSEMVFISNPRDVNKSTTKLMCIMESLPDRVDLSDPTEVFRMNGSMEFIDMKTNEVNADLSKRFSATLQNRGFKYPIYDYSANITAKKNYDEGYLMIDAIGKIFHLKQMAGRPYVAAIPMPDNIRAEKVYIMENADRTKLGFVIDSEYNMYMLRHDGRYYLTKMPVGKVNPYTDRIVVMGNMFNMVLRLTNDIATEYKALSSDGIMLLGELTFNNQTSLSTTIGEYIFPWQLSYIKTTDCYAKLRFNDISIKAVGLNLILCIILLIMLRGSGNTVQKVVKIIAVFIGGIFMFIPITILK